ncbi:dihydrofolate reductase family protein [Anaerotalea alkaliphila]|uniref:Dihydrofolate reductase n=1 Tax=Anaerotalea alkaliphila TaxID=2662126 RepID=A0A7X5HTN0_9FIRM|nr:dihydrofolate reductase family protein [Anaerotalea alkaliphila]NDL66470.1 dihydrofolate reductase [Anaerotalea alkaliphila]
MGREVVLYIAASLDGYIARKDGSLDWLPAIGQEVPEVEEAYEAFYGTVDTVVMGRKTYEQVVREISPEHWPYEGKKCYVASSGEPEEDGRVEWVGGDLVRFLSYLKRTPGKDIWIVGGSRLLAPLVEAGAIDRYIITIIPVLLGEGIPLFVESGKENRLELEGVRPLDGMVELRYRKGNA